MRSNNISPFLFSVILVSCFLFTGPDATAQKEKTAGPFPAETVLLSTDRSIYLSGEVIYLSAAILESDSYKVSKLSSVIRFELLDSEGETGVRHIIYSENGTMAGTIKLPANLPTGWYRLRSYTSWMRNIGPSQFSYKDLRIINPADAGRLNEYTLDDTLMVSVIAGNGLPLTGSLNHCAVRSITRRGRPIAIKGSLVSSYKDTVAYFATGDAGWGALKWVPEPGADYYIVLESDTGIPVLTAVPQHSDSAYSVTVSDPLSVGEDPGKDRNLTVTLRGNIPEKGVKLLAHRMSRWYRYGEAGNRNRRLSFIIPTADLPYGMVAFTFLSDDNRYLASALWIKGEACAGPGSGSVATEAVTEGNSTKFITECRAGDESAKGYYTLTMRRCEPFEITDLYLASLPGWHTTWEIPLDRDEREGWLIANVYDSFVAESFFQERRSKPSVLSINLNDITDTRESMVEYLPETRGMKISGRVNYGNGEPAARHKLSLTGLNDNRFISTQTFSDGRFHFAIPGREGRKDLLLSHIIRPHEKMSISIDPEYDPRLGALPPDNIYLTNAEEIYVNKIIIDNRLENIYRDTTVVSVPAATEQRSTRGMFYGNPDRVIYIDDYIRLPNMREVIFELVPFVSVRKDRDDFSLRVIGETPFPRIYDPLFLIDGIPLLRFNRLLEFPPDRFERIDVINSLYIHGNQIFAGVVNFISVNRDLAGLDLPEGSRILSVDLPGPTVQGELITYSPSTSGIPSLDRTLSYIPLSDPDNITLTYERNPVLGNYITVFTGINEEGKWVNASSPFEISRSYRNN
ncbi:MAG: hypothetical protein U9N72_09405 [Bacteroidota bacterium]|nr:hypothetical protein [Bacteroidota bacterium]